MAAYINSNIALVAIIILLNLTVKIFPLTQVVAAAGTFKIISDQHRSRDTAASALDLTPQQTFIDAASTTHFDDDDDDNNGNEDNDSDGHSRDAGNTYTLVPRESGGSGGVGNERAPTPRFHWPVSATSAEPASSINASARPLGKLLNRDARLRYKVQAQRTLNSSRALPREVFSLSPAIEIGATTGQGGSEKCQRPQTDNRGHELDTWRRKNKKFLNIGGSKQGLLEPILLTSDVKVRSDLVLVRDQEAPAAAAGAADGGNKQTSYDDRLDLLGSLPVRTLSQRVKVVLPSLDKNLDRDRTDDFDQERDEKLFILRGGPGSIRQQPKNQVRSSLSGSGGGDDDDGEETPLSGNHINLEIDDETSPGQTEELTRAADTSSPLIETRKPVRLTVKRKYGLPFSKQPLAADSRHDTRSLTQQLRSAPASTSGIRVTVGNGTRPLVVNNRGLITAAKKQPHTIGAVASPATNTSRPYNPMQLFASSQTSQTLNPIETMVTRRPTPGGAKRKPVANLIVKPPVVAAAAVELAPVNHSHHVDSSGYSLSPITSTTHIDRTHHSTTSSVHLFDTNLNRTSGTTSTTLASGNFHHNPPYQQHHIGHSSTTPTFVSATPPPTPTTARPNNRFQSGSAGQQPARVSGGHTGNRTHTPGSPHKRPSLSPYEPGTADLLSEPANMLQVHQRPNAGNNSAPGLAHLQQSLATTSLKPTKIRIKLLNSLFGGIRPQKTGSSLSANQTSSSLPMHSSGSPAPLLSSTVANNVAALLAQKLTSLMRPPSLPLGSGGHHHLPLNSLFGFRVGPQPTSTSLLGQSFGSSKFKHPFAVASQASASSASSPLNSGINRRTTGVGPLLVSGLIYGLTVLPALMALTGINPLTSSDSSGPLSPAALVASRQQHQNSEKRSKQAKSARQRPSRDTGHHSMLADSATANSDTFAYLLPLLSAPAPATASIQSADAAGQPLGSLSLASPVEPMHVPPAAGHLPRDEAQSSALKSLYAPPPTVLESFGATSGGADFSSLLEDQPTSEIEWPTTGGYMQPGDDAYHSHQRQQPPLYRPGSSWPMSSGASDDSQQPRGSFVRRRNRDLPNERGQWRTTSGGGNSSSSSSGGIQLRPDYAMRDSHLAATTTTTMTAPQTPSASFDDRSATMSGSSFQPQQASRQVSQIASPPPLPNRQIPNHSNAAQQSWSVGMVAPNHGTQQGAHYVAAQQVAQSDRIRQQVSYLVDAQQQQLRQQQQQRQQIAQLGDSDGDFAILGPYRPEPLAPMQVDLGGLRQRRTAVAKMQPPSPPLSLLALGQPMNLTTSERPWQGGDSRPSLADKSRHPGDKSMGISSQPQVWQAASDNQRHRAVAAPDWASESDWRAMEPLAPTAPPSRLPSSNSRQDDRLFHRSQTERSAAVSDSSAKKKSNKNKKSSKRKRLTNSSRSGNTNKSQPQANSSTTKAPSGKDEEESELIMAHSMAMGSRVLNEQLTGHHQ